MPISFLAVVFSLGFLAFVVHLVKTRALREEYSLLWLGLASGFLVLASFRGLMDVAARLVGIYYPPAILFLVWLGFVSLILLNYAVVLSKVKEDSKDQSQELALLRQELERLKRETAGDPR